MPTPPSDLPDKVRAYLRRSKRGEVLTSVELGNAVGAARRTLLNHLETLRGYWIKTCVPDANGWTKLTVLWGHPATIKKATKLQ